MTTHIPPQTPPRRDADAHALPGWVNFIQDNLFLSFLVLAEAYLLGTLMTIGWVGDIEAPSHWGTFHGVGVLLFFLAGGMAAGVALRCSVKAAGCFSRGELGMALFNFLGLVIFSGAEVWASLSERSANLRPTPADGAVLDVVGMHGAPISPTVVVVALLLPFASLYYGFSQQQTRHETDAERAEKAAAEDFALQRKLARAEANARRRQAQAAGVAGMARAFNGAPEATVASVAPQAMTPPLERAEQAHLLSEVSNGFTASDEADEREAVPVGGAPLAPSALTLRPPSGR